MTIVTNQEGTFHYNEKGEYHREDGPAIKDTHSGKKYWVCGVKQVDLV
jgi:hypothetical protein